MHKPEEERQKLFNAAIKRISKIWPDYASFRPIEAQNATDRRAQDRLSATQEALDACWLNMRAPGATGGNLAAFKASLAAWELERMHAAGILRVDTGADKSVK